MTGKKFTRELLCLVSFSDWNDAESSQCMIKKSAIWISDATWRSHQTLNSMHPEKIGKLIEILIRLVWIGPSEILVSIMNMNASL